MWISRAKCKRSTRHTWCRFNCWIGWNWWRTVDYQVGSLVLWLINVRDDRIQISIEQTISIWILIWSYQCITRNCHRAIWNLRADITVGWASRANHLTCLVNVVIRDFRRHRCIDNLKTLHLRVSRCIGRIWRVVILVSRHGWCQSCIWINDATSCIQYINDIRVTTLGQLWVSRLEWNSWASRSVSCFVNSRIAQNWVAWIVSWFRKQWGILICLIRHHKGLWWCIWITRIWCAVITWVRSHGWWQRCVRRWVWRIRTRVFNRVRVASLHQTCIVGCEANRATRCATCWRKCWTGWNWAIWIILNCRCLVSADITNREYLGWWISCSRIVSCVVDCVGSHGRWQCCIRRAIWSLHHVWITGRRQISIRIWQWQSCAGCTQWWCQNWTCLHRWIWINHQTRCLRSWRVVYREVLVWRIWWRLNAIHLVIRVVERVSYNSWIQRWIRHVIWTSNGVCVTWLRQVTVLSCKVNRITSSTTSGVLVGWCTSYIWTIRVWIITRVQISALIIWHILNCPRLWCPVRLHTGRIWRTVPYVCAGCIRRWHRWIVATVWISDVVAITWTNQWSIYNTLCDCCTASQWVILINTPVWRNHIWPTPQSWRVSLNDWLLVWQGRVSNRNRVVSCRLWHRHIGRWRHLVPTNRRCGKGHICCTSLCFWRKIGNTNSIVNGCNEACWWLNRVTIRIHILNCRSSSGKRTRQVVDRSKVVVGLLSVGSVNTDWEGLRWIQCNARIIGINCPRMTICIF